jgi:glycosyltransferase involved in cell wall biosynthesis
MGPPDITDTLPKLNPDFSGRILDYDFYVTRSAAFPQRSYPVYRSVFPSWDNEARRVGGGSSFHGATPDKFQRMVRNAVRETSNTPAPDQRVIFVNAWNEWAEGCHLEPDRRYGYAWLEALRKGLEGEAAAEPTQLPSPPRAQPKPVAAPMPAAAAAGIGPRGDRLILVVHDAYRHGAQYLALNMARFMSQQLKLGLDIVILGDGPLKPDFAAYGVVHDLAGVDPLGEPARRLAQRLRANGAAHAICNTTVTGLFLKTLTEAGVACIALIHELPGLIASYRLENHLHTIQQQARLTVYSSSMLRDRLNAPADKPAIVRTQGLYKRNPARTPEERAAARVRLRRHFRLPGNARIVLGVGYGDLRKGVDLWVDIGKRVMAAHPDAYFLWVGEIESTQVAPLKSWLAASGASDRFLFAGFQADTADFYAGADVYALTSREDPFPTVIMEALDVAVPVVGFEGAGGFTELLHSGVGVTAPMLDTAVFAKAVSEILIDEGARQRMGERGMETVQAEYGFGGYCFDLLSYVGFGVPRVSVVVPNYNYARHLKDRFATVLDQAGGVYELIVLDDCSPDDSIDVARRLLAHEETDWRLIVNTKNSGSPCRQWLKGVEQAKGDIVWIAEADDLTLPGFLEELLPAFRDPDVAMAYCQSKQMAGDGAILCDHYLDYVADIDREKWRRSHVSGGLDEIRTVLAVKNAIPNVSACLFRREALLRALSEGIDDIASYRVAGDWATYVRVLEQGKLAFSARPLNLHRRHENSVTLGSQHEKLLREILSMQQTVRRRHAVPPHVQAIQRAYAQELYQQFGFPEAGPPAVDSHPAFAQYFDKLARAAE